MRKYLMGAAAASLIAASAAQAAPAIATRTAAPVAASEKVGGEPAHLWLGLLGAVLVGIVLWQINDDGDEVLPTSP